MGITLPAEPFQNRDMIDLVRRADGLGYEEVWSLESYTTEAFSPLAAVAMLSEKMRLGTAIVPVFTRPPALIAMSAMTVQQLSGGRFVLGLGISSPQIIGQWMGVPFERPLARTRDTVEAVRAAMTGEKVIFKGRTLSVNGFRLDLERNTPPPPIFLAVQGATMCRLAGEVADGVVTNYITPQALPRMMEYVAEGARKTGREAPREVVCRILTIVDEEPERVSSAMRRHMTPYLITPGYNKFFSEIGFDQEAEQALRAWTGGDRKKATEAISDRMLNDIYLLGSAEYCRERLTAFAEAGVSTVALWFVSLARTPEQRRSNILAALEKLAPR
ncbi:MAG TPA: LLM class F420-dependent oxidoreductase [Candidatus Binataceae bacterium]|jgi:probable F420-dependent oxidoreductase|nr:LLM class F420-dependent oxidoreductase [Candidatus Binataceae bacterium]